MDDLNSLKRCFRGTFSIADVSVVAAAAAPLLFLFPSSSIGRYVMYQCVCYIVDDL